MAGFENDVVFAKNGDFTQLDNQQPVEANGLVTNGQLWIGSTATNGGGTHINVGSLVSPNGSLTVGYSSPNITLEVAGGTTTVTTLTPDEDADGSAATPIAPQSGNINIFGSNPSYATVTETYNSTGASTGNMEVEHRAWTTGLVVDASTTPGTRGTFSTIAAAIAAAVSGQVIFLRPGTYTENLTMKPGVGFVSNGGAIIDGTLTFTDAGNYALRGIALVNTGTANIVACSGSNVIGVSFYECEFYVTTATGINLTNSQATTRIALNNCRAYNLTNTNAFFNVTGGILDLYYVFHDTNNIGTSTVSGGAVNMLGCRWTTTITTSSSGGLIMEYVTMPLGTTCLNHNATSGTNAVRFCQFGGGSATAITVGAGATLNLRNSVISSSNAAALSGSGTLSYGGLTFSNTSSTITVSTQTVLSEGPSRTIGSANSGGTNTLTVTNSSNTASSSANVVATVGGTSAADAAYQAVVSGTTTWTWGVDNSDSDAWVLAQGTALGTNNVIRSSVAGELNYPLQPAFSAYNSATDTNVTGDGTAYTVICDTEIYDQNGDYNSGTGVFTAPVTGKYEFLAGGTFLELGAAFTEYTFQVITSNRTYILQDGNPANARTAGNYLNASGNCYADMDAADTATFVVIVVGSTKTVDVQGGSGPNTRFQGQLIA